MSKPILKTFFFNGESFPVKFLEEVAVKDGVSCQVYQFEDDDSRDLGIITVKAGYKTPLQRVLRGEKTLEGHLSGKGTLAVTSTTGEEVLYQVDEAESNPFSIAVQVGETMQWSAAPDSTLRFFEVCYPPYEDGRFENLSE